jgi:hypothetical protein
VGHPARRYQVRLQPPVIFPATCGAFARLPGPKAGSPCLALRWALSDCASRPCPRAADVDPDTRRRWKPTDLRHSPILVIGTGSPGPASA